MRKGFTLVELLLTMGVVAILATISTVSLVNYRSHKTLDLQTQEIVSVLRDTQNRSITQENGKPWGVHFENPSTGSGFYSLFTGSTYSASNIVSTTTLNSSVEFLDPVAGVSTDVAFSAITGRPNASTTLVIVLKSDSSISRTITISQNGLVAWSKGGGFSSVYPPEPNATYVKTTNNAVQDHYVQFVADPSKSLIGVSENNAWLGSYITDQRLHIDLGSAKTITRILYHNHHYKGIATNRGAKNFTFWGSNTAGDFTDLVYNNNGTWVQLAISQSTFDQHVALDQADPKYITVTNTTAYRYYAFKFANNWGNDTYMGVRRIELQVIK